MSPGPGPMGPAPGAPHWPDTAGFFPNSSPVIWKTVDYLEKMGPGPGPMGPTPGATHWPDAASFFPNSSPVI